jgi:alpha-L-fucosidase
MIRISTIFHSLGLWASAGLIFLSSCHAPAAGTHDRRTQAADSLVRASSGADVAQLDPRLDAWREARFGMFIHWGLYSVLAGEWQGNGGHAEWIRTTAQIPLDEYNNLQAQFNPVKFDADAWCRMAKDAGMKYIVITTKHHDGFGLFDSAQTDWDVMGTPFKRDIMKELAAACRRHGLKIGWYHSIMDWHHPDYLPRRGWEKQRSTEGADFERFNDYLQAQVTELLTNYGPIDIMWFDGEWEGTWNHEYGVELYNLCRKLQPKVIVNNRVDKGRGGMAGMDTGPGYVGDFGTPEQEIPATGMPGVDWETCMTMNRFWGWNKADSQWKSSQDLIRKLVDIASKGGNFLLNIGPKPDGTLPEKAVQRLAEMGQWMRLNGDSIYGTSASPFADLPWGRCTVKYHDGNTTLYLHVFDWPKKSQMLVPGLGNRHTAARLLATGAALGTQRTDKGVIIFLPKRVPDAVDTVIAVEMEGEAIVFRAPEIHAASDTLIDTLEVTMSVPSTALKIRYTLDGSRPDLDSPLYTGSIRITGQTTVRARSFFDGRPVGDGVERKFKQVVLRPALSLEGQSTTSGLSFSVHKGVWNLVPEFRLISQTPAEWGVFETVYLPKRLRGENQGLDLNGFVRIAEGGLYKFALTSDDGSILELGGQIVVDNDGLHGAETQTGVVALQAGWHKFRLRYFNKTGSAALSLKMGLVGEALASVPAQSFQHLIP